MRKRGPCCRLGSVRPYVSLSVRPSVTFVYCIRTAEDIDELLSRPGNSIILVFLLRAPIPNSKGNPVRGAQNSRWCEDFAIFDCNHRLSRKRYEIGPWLLWNVNRNSQAADRYVSVPMTLSNP